jgi:hypothetical protein
VNIGYIIHAYKYPKQLSRLVAALATPNTSFFIHIDRKIDIRPFHSEIEKLQLPSIIWVEREFSNWGTFACVKAVLNALEAGLSYSPKIDYFYCVSGQDYPIKSNITISKYLEEHKDKCFVLHFPLPYSGWKSGGIHRFNRYHFVISKNRYVRRVVNILNFFLPRRTFPLGLVPYGGDFYMGINRAAAKFVIDFQSKHINFNSFFKFVYIPEEIYFPSILLSTEAQDNGVIVENKTLTRSDWTQPAGPYPATMTTSDLKELRYSDCIFARKFDLLKTLGIFDDIEQIRRASNYKNLD